MKYKGKKSIVFSRQSLENASHTPNPNPHQQRSQAHSADSPVVTGQGSNTEFAMSIFRGGTKNTKRLILRKNTNRQVRQEEREEEINR